jgi:A/G-specific adenine glycosylase
MVWADRAGELPERAEQLQTLPGIGPSTAAAIASLCHGERVAILDGNVKRVLSRWLAFDQEVQSARSQQALRLAAQDLLPTSSADMPAFTQGLMDLGALLCKPKSADCASCPVSSDCQAHRQGEALSFPRKGKALQRQSASWWLLVLRNDRGEVALTQRPSTGVWAGLWCCPMFALEGDACRQAQQWLGPQASPVWAPPVKHVLTHRDWWLNWGHVQVKRAPALEGQLSATWWPIQEALQLGLPQPVRQQLLAEL